MAAAYAAVVSVMHLMEQIKLYHARHRIFPRKQLLQLQSLNTKFRSFLDFLESRSHDGAEGLVSKIADVAYATEDVIESYIVDDIHDQFWKTENVFFASTDYETTISNHHSRVLQRLINTMEFEGRNASLFQGLLESYSHKGNSEAEASKKGKSLAQRESSNRFSEELHKVIEDVDVIEKEVLKIKERSKLKDEKPRDLELFGSLRPPPTGKDTVMVFDDVLNRIMDKLTGQQYNLQIIPIVGMGGIGKTTLAKQCYENSEQYFDICGWVTISQEYDMRGMLFDLVQQIGVPIDQKEQESPEYYQFGVKLYQHLTGRRYLIIMDDLWNIEAWDKLKLYLPDNNNGSRIVITTRLSFLANSFGSSDLCKMNLLEENESWSLLCRQQFFQESCPPELVEVGKRIAKNCRGLPLSIVVVGRLLAKSEMTREYWEYVAEDINTSINAEDDERCLKILSLSYRNLPINLKPCFLYMGIFPEDHDIRASKLIKLWVAEGYIKTSREKSLEEIAEDYLKDLIDRNLILSSKFGSTGKIKICKIHDLVRELCLREANKEKLLYVTKMHDRGILQDIISHRRVAIHPSMSHEKLALQLSQAARSTSFLRSLICDFEFDSAPSLNFAYLRVLHVLNDYSSVGTSHLFNSRYLHFGVRSIAHFPSSVHLFWGLQTLIVINNSEITVAPSEIWELTQLRHLMVDGLCLPDPPHSQRGVRDETVLENLQTLLFIRDLRYTEDFLKRVPNVKKLKLKYYRMPSEGLSRYCLKNLGRLHKLQSLECRFLFESQWLTRSDFLENLDFSLSLKKLTLCSCSLNWEDVERKIGMLPHLEKLKLEYCFMGEKWNTIEGQFLCLKVLEVYYSDLVYWTTESSHFPRLECLVLQGMERLKEIPSEIGDIGALQLIQLKNCRSSVAASAKNILEEQHSFGNEDLRVMVEGCYDDGLEEVYRDEDEVEVYKDGVIEEGDGEREREKRSRELFSIHQMLDMLNSYKNTHSAPRRWGEQVAAWFSSTTQVLSFSYGVVH